MNTSYKRRQAEHPNGTIKRQWGFSYILTRKGMNRASADVGFMLIAYNLRRIGNILIKDRLKEYLRVLLSLFLSKIYLSWFKSRHYRTPFSVVLFWNKNFSGLMVAA